MALHDYFCGVCGYVLTNINVPIAIGATAGAPLHCDRRASWIPQIQRMDASNGPGFVAFDTTDGRGEPVHVSSLLQLRRIERESETHQRNGEGQPMVWRRYAQDRTNQDQHTLHRSLDGGVHPTPEAKRRFGGSLKRSVDEPDHVYGPGVHDGNTSALGGGGEDA